jgi:aryl-alcohol dehydrogenase-like predicted oxidoreductase
MADSPDEKAAGRRSGLQRLGLGTVQFGLDYGISNEMGRTQETEVQEILSEAARLGIQVLDTAPSYGVAEEVLGRALPADHDFDIVTKTRPGAVTSVAADFEKSCRWLKQTNLYGILVHHAEDLLGAEGDRLMDDLLGLKQSGRVRKVGVSVYTGDQIDAVLDRLRVDLIQAPVSVFDQRLIQSGHLRKLKQHGMEIHARSVFLQGVLLMPADRLPAHFDRVRSRIRDYQTVLAEHGLTLQGGALGFVRGIRELDAILVGVNTIEHLRQDVAAFQETAPIDYSAFAVDDDSILNPGEWVVL